MHIFTRGVGAFTQRSIRIATTAAASFDVINRVTDRVQCWTLVQRQNHNVLLGNVSIIFTR